MDFGKEEAAKLIDEVLAERVPAIVNKAFDDRIGRWGKKFVPELIEQVSTEVGELLEKSAGSQAGDDGGKPSNGTPAPSAESKRITDLERKLAESEEREAKTRREKALHGALESVHVKGLPPAMVKGLLIDVEESDGAYFVGETPLDEWARDFARSDDGKRYIAANPGSGTGSRPGTNKVPAGGGGEPDDLASALKNALASTPSGAPRVI